MKASGRKPKIGTVYLVGAGPGDPGLLTLRGAELLGKAEAVVYDRLVNPRILEFAPQAERFYGGKYPKTRAPKNSEITDQNRINRFLVRLALRGKTVVRVKGGDPFLFGRGGEEASYLKKHGIPFEVVPGVSAGLAVPAYAGIAVTDRRLASSVVLTTGHEDPDKKKSLVNWSRLAAIKGTIVCFMPTRNLGAIAEALIKAGRPGRTPVCVIERGTLPSQRTVEGTLATIRAIARREKLRAPALAVIGEAARLRREIAWFEKKSFFGKTVLVTRASSQASVFCRMLENHGARVVEFPCIEILPPEDYDALDQALKGIGNFDWLILTSPNGAEHFLARMRALGMDSRDLAGVRIACVGFATAGALLKAGLKADLVPEVFTSEALFAALKAEGEIRGRRFLLARTDIAPPFLKQALEGAGGFVAEATVYRTVRVKHRPAEVLKTARALLRGDIQYAVFTSASTVDFFFELFGKYKRRLKCRFISIGPVTSRALRAHGAKPYREAREHTMEGLLEVMSRG